MTTPLRARLLLHGVELTTGSRNQSYGHPWYNLGAAGALKQVMREHQRVPLPASVMEAIDQVQTKIARVLTGELSDLDTFIDGATYFAIAGELHHLSQLPPSELEQHLNPAPKANPDEGAPLDNVASMPGR